MSDENHETNFQPRSARDRMEKAQAGIDSFDPVEREDAEILILGTMPGEASLKAGEYYGNPRNQFWRIISSILGIDWQIPYDDRCQVLIKNRLALWDVIAHCERERSSLDSHILNEKLNAIDIFLRSHKRITKIVFNGRRAHKLFRKKFPTIDSRSYTFSVLYSTSPACTYSFEKKLCCWRAALPRLTET